MAHLREQLAINSCPHSNCRRTNPTLNLQAPAFETQDNNGRNNRWWCVYICSSCGGVVTAWAQKLNKIPYQEPVQEIYPDIPSINKSIPDKPRELLWQAQESLHAPVGAIMLCASAVDAMLKEKVYKKGTLNQRIDKAAEDHLITDEMAKWAHQIRLDANDQRHADEDATLPEGKDAKLVFDFAVAFAEYLFVLPSKVSRGITDSEPKRD